MIAVSVVLITKNEAPIIADTIRSIKGLTDDIIVVDSGSSDGTQKIVTELGAALIISDWEGFGRNKNKGILAAKNDWIFSIDADEQPDAELIKSVIDLDLSNSSIAYTINRKNFLGTKQIRYGEWGSDRHVRLFNRTKIKWNDAHVHEELIIPADIKIKHLKGSLFHYTMKDVADYAIKITKYALLYAENSMNKGKKAGWLKRNVSPTFSFIQNYLFKLGFLDGQEGYFIAKMTAYYTLLKYARLHELNKSLNRK